MHLTDGQLLFLENFHPDLVLLVSKVGDDMVVRGEPTPIPVGLGIKVSPEGEGSTGGHPLGTDVKIYLPGERPGVPLRF